MTSVPVAILAIPKVNAEEFYGLYLLFNRLIVDVGKDNFFHKHNKDKWRMKQSPRNYFRRFYPFRLKVCWMYSEFLTVLGFFFCLGHFLSYFLRRGKGGVTHVRISNYGGLQWMSKLELGIVGDRSKQVLYRITVLSGLRFCIYFD